MVPHLFEPPLSEIPRRCPFSTDAYQLMRNLAFAHEWAASKNLQWYGFMVALVDGAPKAKVLRQRVDAFKELLKPGIRDRVGTVSYECIADVLDEHGETALAAWTRARVADVVDP